MTMPDMIAGRYEIGEMIGEGAMGEVYRAVDVQTGEPVAVKALRPHIIARSPNLVARFVRESEALRQLDHPNIVKMLVAIEEGGGHYIVMEYVEGGSLHDLLIKTPKLPIERVLAISLELADALTRSHHLGIVHRDIKPANVLLAEDGTPRLTDFGIAQMGDDPGALTANGAVVGTYAYLSPEACMGETLDERSDIWSFGVVIYEMLAGRHPFEGKTAGSMITAILQEVLIDVTDIRPEASDNLSDLLYRMLDKNRSARIPSVRMVGAEIEAITKGLDTTASHTIGKALLQTPQESQFSTPTPTTPIHLNNLPAQTTPFVGRGRELGEIRAMMEDPGCRLITLLGPGGMGKTRLALEIAEQYLHAYPHGVYLTPLAPLTSPEFITATVADSIQYSFGRQDDPRRELLDYLHDKRMLLIMDNVEHVMEEVGLIGEMLSAAPDLRVMATSRVRLSLTAECVYEVGEMAFPSLGEQTIEDFEAVQMFVAYARRIRPNYELETDSKPTIARICQLVGGMPLGIELAAAWVRTLPLEEIAEELEADLDFLKTSMRDVPERHHSMRTVFEYSWTLLTEEEQAVLARLSVFRGAFTRDAAKRIAKARVRALSALVDKSLLRRDPTGLYEVQGLIRQYAEEKLRQNAEEGQETRRRHSNYYGAFLANRAEGLHGGRQKRILEEIEAEIDNIRAAWRYAVMHGEEEDIDRFLGCIPLFYEIRGLPQEGEDMCGWAIDALTCKHPKSVTPGGDKSLIYGRLIGAKARFAYRMGHYDDAAELLERSLAIFRTLESHENTAQCLNTLGNLAWAREDYARAKDYFGESLDIWRKEDNQRGVATVLNNLGAVAIETEAYAEAVSIYEECLAIFREADNQYSVAVSLDNLGMATKGLGDAEAARGYFLEALAMAAELKASPLMLDVLAGLAAVAREPEQAAAWIGLVLGHPASYQETKAKAESVLAGLRETLSEEALVAAQTRGKSLELDAVVEGVLG